MQYNDHSLIPCWYQSYYLAAYELPIQMLLPMEMQDSIKALGPSSLTWSTVLELRTASCLAPSLHQPPLALTVMMQVSLAEVNVSQ